MKIEDRKVLYKIENVLPERITGDLKQWSIRMIKGGVKSKNTELLAERVDVVMYMINRTIFSFESQSGYVRLTKDIAGPMKKHYGSSQRILILEELRKMEKEGLFERSMKGRYYTTKDDWLSYLKENKIEIKDFSSILDSK